MQAVQSSECPRAMMTHHSRTFPYRLTVRTIHEMAHQRRYRDCDMIVGGLYSTFVRYLGLLQASRAIQC